MQTTRKPILAIETSSIACSVALDVGGHLCACHEIIPRGHHERLPGMIGTLLSQAGLAAEDVVSLAFGRGPGSFVGVRLAAATVQAWSLAHELPVFAVSSLAALALSACQDDLEPCRVTAVVKARPGEVYTADFEWRQGLLSRLSEDRRCGVGDMRPAPKQATRHRLVGDACGDFKANGYDLDASALPSAEAVLMLADDTQALGAESALPVYLQPDADWKTRPAGS